MEAEAVKTTMVCRGRLIDLSRPRVMGIVNVTPDSFFAASRVGDHTALLKRAEQILEEGGTLLDLGAYSTRPGAAEVSEEEEVQRLLPALETLRKHYPDLLLSVDTFRSAVARKAVREGEADLINDVSGCSLDTNMFDTIAALKVPYVLMHIQGSPRTMQTAPTYQNVVAEVSLWLAQRVDALRKKGVADILIDPGFGFGKTIAHNYQLLKHLDELSLLAYPLLVGFSRKSMIYKLLDLDPEAALNGTTVLNTIALQKGAKILRVHDVKEAAECVKLVGQLNGVE